MVLARSVAIEDPASTHNGEPSRVPLDPKKPPPANRHREFQFSKHLNETHTLTPWLVEGSPWQKAAARRKGKMDDKFSTSRRRIKVSPEVVACLVGVAEHLNVAQAEVEIRKEVKRRADMRVYGTYKASYDEQVLQDLMAAGELNKDNSFSEEAMQFVPLTLDENLLDDAHPSTRVAVPTILANKAAQQRWGFFNMLGKLVPALPPRPGRPRESIAEDFRTQVMKKNESRHQPRGPVVTLDPKAESDEDEDDQRKVRATTVGIQPHLLTAIRSQRVALQSRALTSMPSLTKTSLAQSKSLARSSRFADSGPSHAADGAATARESGSALAAEHSVSHLAAEKSVTLAPERSYAAAMSRAGTAAAGGGGGGRHPLDALRGGNSMANLHASPSMSGAAHKAYYYGQTDTPDKEDFEDEEDDLFLDEMGLPQETWYSIVQRRKKNQYSLKLMAVLRSKQDFYRQHLAAKTIQKAWRNAKLLRAVKGSDELDLLRARIRRQQRISTMLGNVARQAYEMNYGKRLSDITHNQASMTNAAKQCVSLGDGKWLQPDDDDDSDGSDGDGGGGRRGRGRRARDAQGKLILQHKHAVTERLGQFARPTEAALLRAANKIHEKETAAGAPPRWNAPAQPKVKKVVLQAAKRAAAAAAGAVSPEPVVIELTPEELAAKARADKLAQLWGKVDALIGGTVAKVVFKAGFSDGEGAAAAAKDDKSSDAAAPGGGGDAAAPGDGAGASPTTSGRAASAKPAPPPPTPPRKGSNVALKAWKERLGNIHQFLINAGALPPDAPSEAQGADGAATAAGEPAVQHSRPAWLSNLLAGQMAAVEAAEEMAGEEGQSAAEVAVMAGQAAAAASAAAQEASEGRSGDLQDDPSTSSVSMTPASAAAAAAVAAASAAEATALHIAQYPDEPSPPTALPPPPSDSGSECEYDDDDDDEYDEEDEDEEYYEDGDEHGEYGSDDGADSWVTASDYGEEMELLFMEALTTSEPAAPEDGDDVATAVAGGAAAAGGEARPSPLRSVAPSSPRVGPLSPRLLGSSRRFDELHELHDDSMDLGPAALSPQPLSPRPPSSLASMTPRPRTGTPNTASASPNSPPPPPAPQQQQQRVVHGDRYYHQPMYIEEEQQRAAVLDSMPPIPDDLPAVAGHPFEAAPARPASPVGYQGPQYISLNVKAQAAQRAAGGARYRFVSDSGGRTAGGAGVGGTAAASVSYPSGVLFDVGPRVPGRQVVGRALLPQVGNSLGPNAVGQGVEEAGGGEEGGGGGQGLPGVPQWVGALRYSGPSVARRGYHGSRLGGYGAVGLPLSGPGSYGGHAGLPAAMLRLRPSGALTHASGHARLLHLPLRRKLVRSHSSSSSRQSLDTGALDDDDDDDEHSAGGGGGGTPGGAVAAVAPAGYALAGLLAAGPTAASIPAWSVTGVVHGRPLAMSTSLTTSPGAPPPSAAASAAAAAAAAAALIVRGAPAAVVLPGGLSAGSRTSSGAAALAAALNAVSRTSSGAAAADGAAGVPSAPQGAASVMTEGAAGVGALDGGGVGGSSPEENAGGASPRAVGHQGFCTAFRMQPRSQHISMSFRRRRRRQPQHLPPALDDEEEEEEEGDILIPASDIEMAIASAMDPQAALEQTRMDQLLIKRIAELAGPEAALEAASDIGQARAEIEAEHAQHIQAIASAVVRQQSRRVREPVDSPAPLPPQPLTPVAEAESSSLDHTAPLNASLPLSVSGVGRALVLRQESSSASSSTDKQQQQQQQRGRPIVESHSAPSLQALAAAGRPSLPPAAAAVTNCGSGGGGSSNGRGSAGKAGAAAHHPQQPHPQHHQHAEGLAGDGSDYYVQHGTEGRRQPGQLAGGALHKVKRHATDPRWGPQLPKQTVQPLPLPPPLEDLVLGPQPVFRAHHRRHSMPSQERRDSGGGSGDSLEPAPPQPAPSTRRTSQETLSRHAEQLLLDRAQGFQGGMVGMVVGGAAGWQQQQQQQQQQQHASIRRTHSQTLADIEEQQHDMAAAAAAAVHRIGASSNGAARTEHLQPLSGQTTPAYVLAGRTSASGSAGQATAAATSSHGMPGAVLQSPTHHPTYQGLPGRKLRHSMAGQGGAASHPGAAGGTGAVQAATARRSSRSSVTGGQGGLPAVMAGQPVRQSQAGQPTTIMVPDLAAQFLMGEGAGQATSAQYTAAAAPAAAAAGQLPPAVRSPVPGGMDDHADVASPAHRTRDGSDPLPSLPAALNTAFHSSPGRVSAVAEGGTLGQAEGAELDIDSAHLPPVLDRSPPAVVAHPAAPASGSSNSLSNKPLDSSSLAMQQQQQQQQQRVGLSRAPAVAPLSRWESLPKGEVRGSGHSHQDHAVHSASGYPRRPRMSEASEDGSLSPWDSTSVGRGSMRRATDVGRTIAGPVRSSSDSHGGRTGAVASSASGVRVDEQHLSAAPPPLFGADKARDALDHARAVRRRRYSSFQGSAEVHVPADNQSLKHSVSVLPHIHISPPHHHQHLSAPLPDAAGNPATSWPGQQLLQQQQALANMLMPFGPPTTSAPPVAGGQLGGHLGRTVSNVQSMLSGGDVGHTTVTAAAVGAPVGVFGEVPAGGGTGAGQQAASQDGSGAWAFAAYAANRGDTLMRLMSVGQRSVSLGKESTAAVLAAASSHQAVSRASQLLSSVSVDSAACKQRRHSSYLPEIGGRPAAGAADADPAQQRVLLPSGAGGSNSLAVAAATAATAGAAAAAAATAAAGEDCLGALGVPPAANNSGTARRTRMNPFLTLTPGGAAGAAGDGGGAGAGGRASPTAVSGAAAASASRFSPRAAAPNMSGLLASRAPALVLPPVGG